MSNKHRKKSAPKPTLDDFMRSTIMKIRGAFRVPMHVTIAIRHPENIESEILYSDDDMDALIEMLQRRRDALIASRPVGEQPA